MATTQVAEAEKNPHKHMTEKNKGKELKMAGSRRDVFECGNMTTNTQQSGHGTLTCTYMEEDTMQTVKWM